MAHDYTFRINTIPQHPHITTQAIEDLTRIHNAGELDELKVAYRTFSAQLADSAVNWLSQVKVLDEELPLEAAVNLDEGNVKVGAHVLTLPLLVTLYLQQSTEPGNFNAGQTTRREND